MIARRKLPVLKGQATAVKSIGPRPLAGRSGNSVTGWLIWTAGILSAPSGLRETVRRAAVLNEGRAPRP
jgi:hypothetical protein